MTNSDDFHVIIGSLEVDQSVLKYVPACVARENSVLPVGRRGKTLVIAMPDTLMDHDLLLKLQFIFNRTIEAVFGPREQIAAAIDHYYGPGCHCDNCTTGGCCISVDRGDVDAVSEPFECDVADETSPVAKFVELVIAEVIQLRASQILFKPEHDCLSVWYWIDEKFAERDKPPRRLHEAIVARTRFLAGISADGGNEQIGQITGASRAQAFLCQVHICPAEHGEGVRLYLTPIRG